MSEKKPLELRPHQIDTITRVVARCQKQKGMILFHEMGTGKTLTALGILLNYPFDQTTIFCDITLTYTWQNEMKKIDFENLKKSITYSPPKSKTKHQKNNTINNNATKKKIKKTELKNYDKDNFANNKELENYDFKNKVVVIDEAHNIANMLKKMDLKKAKDLLENFKKCKKIILLSGTPIFQTYTDLSVLINIAAGKHIVTYNRYEFLSRYMKLDPKTSLTHGHIYPKIVRGINQTLGIASRFLLPNSSALISVVVSFIMGKPISAYENMKQKTKDWINQYNPISHYLTSYQQNGKNKNNSSFDVKNNAKNSVKIRQIRQNSKNDNVKIEKKESSFFQYLKHNGFGRNMSTLTEYGRYLISAYIFVYVLTRASYNIMRKIDTYGIYELAEFGSDNTHIVTDLVPYIDFYKPDSSFPRRININKKVDYNYYQIEEWLRLAYEVDTDNAKRLNENEMNNTHNLQFEPLDQDQYIDYGRVIGNLTYKNIHPPKFVELLKFIKQNKGQHLIYSNFQHKGSTLLKAFFDIHQVSYAFLHPGLHHKEIDKMLEDYKTGKNPILILHHNFIEGISVPGTTYFHILEPVLEFSKYNQIIGRSLRSDSHTHLPPEERFVKIINWKCSCREFNSKQKQKMLKYKIWTQFFSQVEIQKMENEAWWSRLYSTPDEMSFQYMEPLLIFKDILQKETLKHGNKICATGETKIKCEISTFQKKGNCSQI